MMHEVRAEPLDHRTRSVGLETGEVCQRTSHPPHLQVCSTCYGSGTTAPSELHLPREGYPLKRNPVVEAPCPGPSDIVKWGGGGSGANEWKWRLFRGAQWENGAKLGMPKNIVPQRATCRQNTSWASGEVGIPLILLL